MGRILAVDPGTKRLGLALTDPSGRIAMPRGVIAFSRLETALDEVKRLVREEDVERIVVGLPLGMSGQEGPAARQARKLMAHLAASTGLEVVAWDERLTTLRASKAMREGGVRAREQRGRVDMVAAALILQGYLEATTGEAAGVEDHGKS